MHARAVRAAAFLISLGLCAPAWAAADLIVPVSQTRTLAGAAFAEDGSGTDSDSDAESAPGFGPFVEGAAAQANVPNAQGSGGGTQDSEILASSIVASGTSFATAEGFDFDGLADGSGSSGMNVTFDLTAEANYTLTAVISAFDSGTTDLSLKDSGGEIFGACAQGPSEMISIAESGTLPAGQYTLETCAEGSVFGDFFGSGFASSEYDVTFSVAEPPKVRALGGTGSLALLAVLALAGTRALRRRAG